MSGQVQQRQLAILSSSFEIVVVNVPTGENAGGRWLELHTVSPNAEMRTYFDKEGLGKLIGALQRHQVEMDAPAGLEIARSIP